ncbi:MAG: ribonuclease H-like domain-containing protein [Bacteroidales bacterium]|nr:ribonuclease H-like domain-containing protein [Bacteroidales bacterium]
MLDKIELNKILFLDIETVPAYPSFAKVPERYKKLWTKKAQFLLKDEKDTPKSIYPRAGIYAEFGKIVCISVAFFHKDELRVKSYYSDDEKLLLEEFALLLRGYFNTKDHLLCGHNGKEFDFPYIARRMLINRIKLPNILDMAGKKPWEIRHLDTMELWKFGDFKNYTSLDLLTAIFDIPTPKDDIDGSEVWSVYWKENDLERIKIYCEKDTIAVVQIFLSYLGKDLLEDSSIIFTK